MVAIHMFLLYLGNVKLPTFGARTFFLTGIKRDLTFGKMAHHPQDPPFSILLGPGSRGW